MEKRLWLSQNVAVVYSSCMSRLWRSIFLQHNDFFVCLFVYFWVHVYFKDRSQGCAFRQTDAPLGRMNGEGNGLVSWGKEISARMGRIADVVHLSPCPYRQQDLEPALKVALGTVGGKNISDLGWCSLCCFWFIQSCRRDGRNRWCLSWWIAGERRRVFCSVAEASLSSYCHCFWHRVMGRGG